MGKMFPIAKKLMLALGTKGIKLTLTTKQFMGREGVPHMVWCLNRATWDDSVKRYKHTEIFSTGSLFRLVFYLRDMWYRENGWDLPMDDERWNETRKELEEKSSG